MPLNRPLAGIVLLMATLLPAVPGAGGPAFRDPALPVEQRVDDLLGRLTLDEKLTLLGGVDGFFLPGVERLGVPRIKLGDGPVGVRNWGPSTLYPATVLLAATWNEALAARFGTSLGRDSRARGMHISLAPGVNIYRSPLAGRSYEYMGEDPLLAGRLAVASIRAVQAQGVAATIKHFAANNSETRRSYISHELDERTLREIYLPAFRRAVQEANVGCVMNAYNPLNGEYCTAHDWLTNEVLKREWGFAGVVMSDWNATHDTLGAALGGLDLEMPAAKYFAPDKLRPLIANGTIPLAVIDEKVRRQLRLIISFGWLEREQQDRSIPPDDPASAATALAVAREGIVLLKNEGGLLPLDPGGRKTVAVLGPNAFQVVIGLGSGKVKPFHAVSLAEGLRAKLGEARVITVPWAEPLDLLAPSQFADGLQLEVYSSRRAAKPLVREKTDRIALAWDKTAPSRGLTAEALAFARWTGQIAPQTGGDYQIVVHAKDAGVRVWLDDRLQWDSLREATGSFVVRLAGGKRYRFRLEAEQRKKNLSFRLAAGWGPARPLLTTAQAEAVRQAEAAVIEVGFNVLTGEGEGNDRGYALPGRQEELIRLVAGLNPRTVVILNTGGSVATMGWIKKVPALLHAFYTGQEGGTALAEILLGKVNPSGRLPFSYEQRWEDCAAHGNYPEDHADESVTQISYKEGIFLGYRWFDAKGIAPLFPFGHGLSYTTFVFANMKASPAGEQVRVTLDVSNTGLRAGASVVQLYVGQPQCTVPRPPRELKAFAKVALQPGETRAVELTLDRDAFAFFHPAKKQWTVEPGDFVLEAGASSGDLPLREIISYGH